MKNQEPIEFQESSSPSLQVYQDSRLFIKRFSWLLADAYQLHLYLMQSQKTSFIKRTGQGARREFQLMHLAVFPFQFQFLKNVGYPIVAYFEKGNQIIGVNGDIPIIITGGNKGDKQQLSSKKNKIFFHLYSESNVVYKWSLYKRHPSGQEEYLQSCAFNLREVVINYILPHRGEQNAIDSILSNDFHEKQLRGKFIKVGVILSFSLMLATEATLIDSYIQQQFCQPSSKKRNQENVIDIENGDVVPKQEETLEQDSFQSASMLSDMLLKNDSKIIDTEPEKEQLPAAIQSALQSQFSQDKKQDLSWNVNLDQLIIDGAEGRVIVRPPHEKNANDGLAANDDLSFQFKLAEDIPAQLKVEEAKKLRHSNSRDYSLLKLDSDQGRQGKVEQIDARLGKQELDKIEEEERTIKQSARIPIQQKIVKKGHLLTQKRTGDEVKSSILVERLSFKRAVFILVVVACVFLVAATYRYNFKRDKSRLRHK